MRGRATRRPHSLSGPGQAVFHLPFRRPRKGRAERQGHDGPTGLDASRHRGLSKSVLLRACGASEGCRKSAVSLASRARCLRLAPRRPRWADNFFTRRWWPPAGEPDLARLGPPAASLHLQRNVIAGHRVPPRHLKMLTDTPFVRGRMNVNIILAPKAVKASVAGASAAWLSAEQAVAETESGTPLNSRGRSGRRAHNRRRARCGSGRRSVRD
jgi:hypothetical protein